MLLDEKHNIFSTDYGIILKLMGHVCLMRNIVSFPPIIRTILKLMGHVCLMRNIVHVSFPSNYGNHFTAYWTCLLDEKQNIISANYGAHFTALIIGHDVCLMRSITYFLPIMGINLKLMGHVCLMRNIVSFPSIMGIILQLIGMFFDEKHSFLSTNYGAIFLIKQIHICTKSLISFKMITAISQHTHIPQ